MEFICCQHKMKARNLKQIWHASWACIQPRCIHHLGDFLIIANVVNLCVYFWGRVNSYITNLPSFIGSYKFCVNLFDFHRFIQNVNQINKNA